MSPASEQAQNLMGAATDVSQHDSALTPEDKPEQGGAFSDNNLD